MQRRQRRVTSLSAGLTGPKGEYDGFQTRPIPPYQIVVLARRLSAGLAEIYSDQYGLAVSEWRVLAHLHDAGTCSVREIHLQADLEKSRVSRAVAALKSAAGGRAAHRGTSAFSSSS